MKPSDHRYDGKKIDMFVALDPGGTTGATTYTLSDHELYIHEYEGHHLERLYDDLFMVSPDVVVCERFDYRPKQGSADLTPVEVIGVVKLYCEKTDTPLVMQGQIKGEPGKGFWDDEKMKKLGLHVPGKPHGTDSARQALEFVTMQLKDLHWVMKLKDK